MLGLLAALQVKLRVRKAMCARARAVRCSDAALCLAYLLLFALCGVCKLWRDYVYAFTSQNTNKRFCLVAEYLNRARVPGSNSVLWVLRFVSKG